MKPTRLSTHLLEHKLLDAIDGGDLPEIQRLVSAGANVNWRTSNSDGETPLIRAITTRRTDVVGLLIKSGADANLRQSGGRCWTPLMFAHDNSTITRQLIEAGADINARTRMHGSHPCLISKQGSRAMQTALHLAAAASNSEVVDLLIRSGADVEAQSDDGLAPLDLAIALGRPTEAARLLVEAGAKLTPDRIEKMHATAHPPDSSLWRFPWAGEVSQEVRPHAVIGAPAETTTAPRCPNCGSLLYSRRAKACGNCGEAVPQELQSSEDSAQLLHEQRRWARELASVFGTSAPLAPGRKGLGRVSGGSPEDADFTPHPLLRGTSCAEEFARRPRPEFWLYVAGYVVLMVSCGLIVGSAGLSTPVLVIAAGVFVLLCYRAWNSATPLCPHCKQNIRTCTALYCHLCGKPMAHGACAECGVNNSTTGILLAHAHIGNLRWIRHCPGCGTELDTRVRRWRFGGL